MGDARNVALILRDDEGLLSPDQRAARLRAWLDLNPFTGRGAYRAGRHRAGSRRTSGRIGSSVARQNWFLRGRAAGVIVVTDGAEADSPFGAAVALGERGQDGLLRLDANPIYFTKVEEDVRRAAVLPETLGFLVATPDSRVLAGTPTPSGR